MSPVLCDRNWMLHGMDEEDLTLQQKRREIHYSLRLYTISITYSVMDILTVQDQPWSTTLQALLIQLRLR